MQLFLHRILNCLKLAIVDSAEDAQKVALAFMNTILGGAGGALAALGSNYIFAFAKGISNFIPSTHIVIKIPYYIFQS